MSSGIGFWELLLLFVIGLLILGPERLPRVATQIGRWVGRARRTANQLRYQLEREIALADIEKDSRDRRDKQNRQGKQNEQDKQDKQDKQDSEDESAGANAEGQDDPASSPESRSTEESIAGSGRAGSHDEPPQDKGE